MKMRILIDYWKYRTIKTQKF